jgi:hypothetical protein
VKRRQLEKHLRKLSGRDLDEFFQRWLYESGIRRSVVAGIGRKSPAMGAIGAHHALLTSQRE